MSEIPADVMKAARDVFENLPLGHEAGSVEVIARAIMAERERGMRNAAYEFMRLRVGYEGASSFRFRGLVFLLHPDMPPHVWDGEKMTRLEIGVDLAAEEQS